MNETMKEIETGEPGQILTSNDEGAYVWVDVNGPKTVDYYGPIDFTQKMQSIMRMLFKL